MSNEKEVVKGRCENLLIQPKGVSGARCNNAASQRFHGKRVCLIHKRYLEKRLNLLKENN